MRFGLVGTGPWAGMAHGPGLLRAAATRPDTELVGVWGRSAEKASVLADTLGVPAYPAFEGLLDEVDAVAFAVPPEVQGDLALRAAGRGKHLLLDKPVAADPEVAHRLERAVQDARVSSVVLFTDQFLPENREWLREIDRTAAERGPWRGGWAHWLSALWTGDSPFGESPWRREHGAIRDIGPHALAVLTLALGPIREVKALRGAADLVHLVVLHDSGATSTASLTHSAPPEAESSEVTVWGPAGVTRLPVTGASSGVASVAVAAAELEDTATSGAPHRLDVHFGARIVELVADAEAQLAGQSAPAPSGEAARSALSDRGGAG